ncbi:MAG TPA: sulfatase-like hydrolase/transferase, partial [Acidimicrobiia bacterium]|nr:sulfatase-like hydrolase/transferase [Acidimicrobiia bacterium]
MIFWAQNAWDLSSPNKILAIGAAVGVLGILAVWLLARIGIERRAAALGVATGILILAEWEKASNVPVYLKLVVPIAVVWIGQLLSRSKLLELVAVVVVAVFGVAPLVQLVLAHIDQAQPYPLKQLAGAGPAEPTGLVEDVVVVIVDSYPSLYVASEWQGHDTSPLVDTLSDLDFDVPNAAWSQLTFTALSVPSMLELQPVVGEGPIEPWGNVSSANRIIRGDNLVANTLRNAGFAYTHIESGADPLACGGMVESCAESTWIDEPVWELLNTTVVARWMEKNLGFYSVAGTLNSAANLTRIGDELADNGSHDYIFAHLFLPHPPVVVDAQCQVRAGGPFFEAPGENLYTNADYVSAFSAQLACADDLVTRLAAIARPSTAMIITADHGTGFSGQVGRDGSTWTDAEIAERLGIMLAYRLPEG